jgi:protease inhibitor Inh
MRKAWAGGALMAMALAGCAGQGFGGKPQQPETGMAGRWIMAAPNAPTCGMNFIGPAGARSGNVSPEGGCPGNLFLSRRWMFEADVLVIDDDENNPLARLNAAGGRYEGQSTAGLSVSLARPPAPPAN